MRKKLRFANWKVCTVVLSLLLLFCGSLTVVLKPDERQSKPVNAVSTTAEGSGESAETFNDADTDFEFRIDTGLTLKVRTLHTYLKVVDQEGTLIYNTLRKQSGYMVCAPSGGYTEGFTYTVFLLHPNLQFASPLFAGKDRMSFSIQRPEIVDIEEKEHVRHLDSVAPILYAEGNSHFVTVESDFAVQEQDVLILPTIEYGFETERSFKVKAVERENDFQLLTLEDAEFADTYERLNVNLSMSKPQEEKYYKFNSIAEIESQLEQTSVYQQMEQLSHVDDVGKVHVHNAPAPSEKPELKIDIKNEPDKITVTFEMAKKNLFKSKNESTKIDLVYEAKIIFKMDAKLNINIFRGVFELGNFTDVTFESVFSLKFSSTVAENIGSEKNEAQLKAIEKYIFGDGTHPKNEHNFDLCFFTVYYPTPIPGIGIMLQGNFVFKVEVKAEINIKLEHKLRLDFGLKKESDGLKSFQNNSFLNDLKSIKLEGKITVKVGARFGAYLNIVGIANVGIEAEGGAYITLSGVLSVNFEDEAFDAYNYGIYLEAGGYVELAVSAKIDFGFWKTKIKFVMFEKKFPLVQAGFKRKADLAVHNADNVIVLSQTGLTDIPSIDIKVRDMFSNAKHTSTISSAQISSYFDIEDTENLRIANGKIENINTTQHEFEDTLTLKLKAGKLYEIIDEDYTSAPIYWEIFQYSVSMQLKVTKQPVGIESIALTYEQVTYDPQYETLYGKDELYQLRSDDDFQIGRMVRINPVIYPENASYKTLTYSIDQGQNLIRDFRMFTENGITYAEFRIKNETAIIGQSIRISATSTGYAAGSNVSSGQGDPIVASDIPAVYAELMPVQQGAYVEHPFVTAGEQLQFAINAETLLPFNATRGTLAGEEVYVEYGHATVLGTVDHTATVKIDADAPVGSQIAIAVRIQDLYEYYFLQVIKNAVQDIHLDGGPENININETRCITATLVADAGTPSFNDVVFAVLEGTAYCSIVRDAQDKTKAYLTVGGNAQAGQTIKVVAIIDGKISAPLLYTIGKIQVDSIQLSFRNRTSDSTVSTVVRQGDVIELQGQVYPAHASQKALTYRIDENNSTKRNGKFIGSVERTSGELFINYYGVWEDYITLIAAADGVEQSITFTMAKQAVTNIKFLPDRTTVYMQPGQSILLGAEVNFDASVQAVGYEIVSGSEFGEIDPLTGLLTIAADVEEDYSYMDVMVYSLDDPSVAAYMSVLVLLHAELNVSVGGMIEDILMLSDEALTVTVTDESGAEIDVADVDLYVLDSSWEYSEIAQMQGNQLIIDQQMLLNYPDMFFVLVAEYNGYMRESYVTVEYAASNLILNEVSTMSSLPVEASGGEIIAFEGILYPSLIEAYNIRLRVLEGSGYAYNATIYEYGMEYVSMFLMVDKNALQGERIVIEAYWTNKKGAEIKSQPFYVDIVSDIEQASISNIQPTMFAGERLLLELDVYPDHNAIANKAFYFRQSWHSQFASLDPHTGELQILDQYAAVGHSITVFAVVNGIATPDYTIQIKNRIEGIEMSLGQQSQNTRFLTQSDTYLLAPGGVMEVVPVFKGIGGSLIENADYEILLCELGRQYLNVTGNQISVKPGVEKFFGSHITLVIRSGDFLSETFLLYIPALVYTAEDFFAIQNNLFGFYMLANDIDFEEIDFTPIRNFYGIFDGNHFNISNVKLQYDPQETSYGLFRENNGLIINLFASVDMRASALSEHIRYVGGIAGINRGSIVSCVVYGEAKNILSVYTENCFLGGIAGYNSGLIFNCENAVLLFGQKYVGGMAGYNDGEISYCVNSENIVVEDFDPSGIVGITGFHSASGILETNTNFGLLYNAETAQYIIENEHITEVSPEELEDMFDDPEGVIG